jgi:uncharacterized protein YjbI with pentapeptide repeats
MKRLAGFTSTILTGCIFCVPFTVLGENSGSTASVSDNIDKLIKTNSCRECNLEGANLNRLELAGADLEGADLSKAKLYLTNLAGANLKNSRLCDAGLGGADLADADLRGADLTGTSLGGAYTVGALFDTVAEPQASQEIDIEDVAEAATSVEKSSAELAEVVEKTTVVQDEVVVSGNEDKAEIISDAQPLSVVKAVDAETPMVNTIGSAPLPKKVQPMKAIEVDESAIAAVSPVTTVDPVIVKDVEPREKGSVSDSPEAIVDDPRAKAMARLLERKRCYGCDLSGLNFSGTDLKGVDLEKADLTGCNFSGANLRNGNFKGAVVLNANLRDTDLRGADFYKADLSGTDLTGAKVDMTIFEDAQMSGVTGLNRGLLVPEIEKR